MARALPEEAAFSRWLTPETIWRGSCAVAGEGASDQAEWLHDMAVDLLDIRELPETPTQSIREQLLGGDRLAQTCPVV